MRPEVKNWWAQAESDLESAEKALNSSSFYVCAFLCEQAAQKALKALYIKEKRTYAPRTHDLIFLGNSLNVNKELIHFLRKLAPHFILTRYPDAAGGVPANLYDQNIATECLQMAKEVLEWVKGHLTK